MLSLTDDVVREFCHYCGHTQYCFSLVHRLHENHRKDLEPTAAGRALGGLRDMTKEYVLLAIAKLHDPAVTNGSITLGLDYVVRYGGWSTEVRTKLEKLKAQLDAFVRPQCSNAPKDLIRAARDKILCHRDLSVILDEQPLGAFDMAEAAAYFDRLEEFADLVRREACGKGFKFDRGCGESDVDALIAAIGSADRIPPPRPEIPW